MIVEFRLGRMIAGQRWSSSFWLGSECVTGG